MWLNTQIKSDFLLCQLGHAKQQEITNPFPPTETQQRHDQT